MAVKCHNLSGRLDNKLFNISEREKRGFWEENVLESRVREVQTVLLIGRCCLVGYGLLVFFLSFFQINKKNGSSLYSSMDKETGGQRRAPRKPSGMRVRRIDERGNSFHMVAVVVTKAMVERH